MGTGWLAGGAPGGRRRLGEVLVAGKVLTDAQLNEALRVQREDKGRRRRLGEVITALGLADEVAIARALSDQLGLPFLDLGNLPIPEETLAVLPRNVALRHGAVPVTLAHDVLTVALADPTNVLALDDIRLATKLASVRTAVATASDIKEAVNRYYGGGASAGETFGSLADVEGLEPPRSARRTSSRSATSTTPRWSGWSTPSWARPCTAAPPTSTSSPRSARCASATASTGCCARSRSSPRRSRGR
jgi:type IV pilus assembly protein PilB